MSRRPGRRRFTRYPLEVRALRILRPLEIAFFVLISVFPFYYMVLLSMREISSVIEAPGSILVGPGELSTDTYERVLRPTSEGGLRFLVNSAGLASATVVVTLAVSLLGAYAVRRPGGRAAGRAAPHPNAGRWRAMSEVTITAGPLAFRARFEREAAPETCAHFEGLLPFRNEVIHVRWSGEAAWIPLGETETGLPFEHHTSHPAPGEILLYPGGFSETEILFPYGGCRFASIVGQLAGNHFLTVTEGREHMRELGRLVLWEGAQDIVFERT